MKKKPITNATTRHIIEWLNFNGHLAWRNNAGGVYDPTRKVFRSPAKWSNSTGSGDVICCLKGGQYLEIEVKTGKDKMSPAQIKRMARVTAIGGNYLLVHTFPDFLSLFEKNYPKLKEQSR